VRAAPNAERPVGDASAGLLLPSHGPNTFRAMAWFRKERKPRLPRRERLEIPADAWEKCEACGHTDLREKFVRNLNVCPVCDYHRRVRAIEYVNILMDEGSVEETDADIRSTDPLGFPEYPQRLKRATTNAGESDAILTVAGTLQELPLNLGVMDFAFMGGSMGSVVGEKIARLGQRSLERKHPLVLVSASGGARMQEGVLSLMQMAKASVMLAQLAERRIPYISLLTNPTTGGVSASFAMLGDTIIAEPGAVIGFAGPRVIKQTIGQDLPEGFQTAEFLLDHGMLDMVTHRRDLKATIGRLLRHMMGKPAASGWVSP
jgi:acetyl-CoA carboxylase carboxyl transferase subunit beta